MDDDIEHEKCGMYLDDEQDRRLMASTDTMNDQQFDDTVER